MMRFLIRIAALGIIVGGVYVIKNAHSDVAEPVTETNKTEATQAVTQEDTAETVVSKEELSEVIKKIEQFTKKDVVASVENNTTTTTQTNNTNTSASNTNKKTATKTTKVDLEETNETTEIPAKVWPKSATTVYMYDFQIDMGKRVFPAGDITFTVKNSGLFAHQFAIEGIKNYGLVGRDATETFTVRITEPGTYKISSEKEMDIEREMYEYITVE